MHITYCAAIHYMTHSYFELQCYSIKLVKADTSKVLLLLLLLLLTIIEDFSTATQFGRKSKISVLLDKAPEFFYLLIPFPVFFTKTIYAF
jgi:hypothetical protein